MHPGRAVEIIDDRGRTARARTTEAPAWPLDIQLNLTEFNGI